MQRYSVPWHVSLLTLFFNRAYPLYRIIYNCYKHISDKKLQQFFRNILKNKRLVEKKHNIYVLDIGANIGFYTKFFTLLLGNSGKVLAFEPAPKNVAHLRTELAAFSTVEIYACAVSDTSGEADLCLSPNSTIDHHLENVTSDHADYVRVPVVTIDEVCTNIPAVDLIKIDIQGAECRALQGMTAVLARSPDVVIMMELWPWGFSRMGDSWQKLKQLLDDNNLTAKGLTHDDVWLFCQQHDKDPDKYTNIVITRKC